MARNAMWPSAVGQVLASVLMLVALNGFAMGQSAPGDSYARTEGRWIVDGQGRVLILHGVNVANSCKAPPFLPWQSKDEIAWLRKAGFDSVRYLTVWEAVEPQPGQYDDSYLDQVAERLEWCREAGLKVVLDMHQDLYSRKYGGDGAPEWACVDDGLEYSHPGGGWFMAYMSPAVMRAFDNFYANKPGPGGVGIQDRFIAMWQHVAKRFRDDTNVIGYNVINEPSYGSAFGTIIGAMAMGAMQQLGPEAGAALAGQGGDPASSGDAIAGIVKALLERDALFPALDAASAPAQEFERAVLQPFYNRVVAAIREADPHHVIFLDPPPGDMSGALLRSGLEAPQDAAGRPFPNLVFSLHFYDFSTNFDFPYTGTSAYLKEFLARAQQRGDSMGMPTWFGEWGTWSPQVERPDGGLLVRHHMDAFDELLCGWAYWQYGKEFQDLAVMPLITRPYAEAIAGVPSRMHSTDERFELDFAPLENGGETVIWVPPSTEAEVEVAFAGKGTAQTSRDDSGAVRVTCSPGADACTVTISLSGKGWSSAR
ncbi:MAG: cellulase family glycosylhydrolase [Armatimonadota bacterium]|nr:MAG: cellulase family glycosylhydrolase [Armatimonadota bacterium]